MAGTYSLPETSSIFCFLKRKVLIKFHCQRLSPDNPFSPSVHPPSIPQIFNSKESTSFLEEWFFFPTVLPNESWGQVFEDDTGGWVREAGKPAACNQRVKLLERSELNKILTFHGWFYMFWCKSLSSSWSRSGLWWDLQKGDLIPPSGTGLL